MSRNRGPLHQQNLKLRNIQFLFYEFLPKIDLAHIDYKKDFVKYQVINQAKRPFSIFYKKSSADKP